MTESPGTSPRRPCAWCGRPLADRSGPGRPRRFCSQRCRQWAWVSGRRAAELDLSEHELVMAREELDRLRDDVFVVACAVEDVRRELAEAPGPLDRTALERALQWLLTAATPLQQRR